MSLSAAEISQFFTEGWFAPGLVDRLLIAGLHDNFCEADDRSPEHYRWRAFTILLRQRRPASEALLHQLLGLAEIDPDPSLRDSMAITLLSLPECPIGLVSGTSFNEPGIQALVSARRLRTSASRPLPDGDWTLVTADICRDGGSYEATLRRENQDVSLLLSLAPQTSATGARHGALFATNGSDPTPMEFLATPREERGWALALGSAAATAPWAAERAKELVAILLERAHAVDQE